MDYKIHWVDVNQNVQQRTQPVVLLTRPLLHGTTANNGGAFAAGEVARTGRYYVPTSNLLESPVSFSLVQAGEFVRVPMWAYRTTTFSLPGLVATGIELGISGLAGLRKHTAEEIESITLVLGHECHEVDQSFRCYAGLSFRMK